MEYMIPVTLVLAGIGLLGLALLISMNEADD